MYMNKCYLQELSKFVSWSSLGTSMIVIKHFVCIVAHSHLTCRRPGVVYRVGVVNNKLSTNVCLEVGTNIKFLWFRLMLKYYLIKINAKKIMYSNIVHIHVIIYHKCMHITLSWLNLYIACSSCTITISQSCLHVQVLHRKCIDRSIIASPSSLKRLFHIDTAS